MLKVANDQKNEVRTGARQPVELRRAELDDFVGAAVSLTPRAGRAVTPTTTCGETVTGISGRTGAPPLRYKTKIETLSNALARVASLRGVSYDWRSGGYRDQRLPEGRAVGVLARDVERVIPEAVVTGPNGYKGVYYAQLIPLLIESIKELKAQNEDLRNLIADGTAGTSSVIAK